MYAVVKTGGKQYCVKEGDVLSVEKVALEDGQDTVEFTEVLAINDGEMVVGTPTVEGAKVEGKVVEEGKSKKVVVYKYKSKKDYRRKQGHRQPFTKIQITKIDSGK
ncbi:MAG TPA: 50S ribosomal protein L21 [Eubacteriaceae bacterium]|nr:50S ribosomal protein L21 [Eubacteriaceae bacterium]